MKMPRFDLFYWSLLEKTLTWAYAGEVRPDFRNRDMNSFQVGLWQILRGQVVLDWDSGGLRGGPGDWILLPPGPLHQRFTDDAEILSIRFAFSTESHECLFDLNHPLCFEEVPRAFERSCRNLVHTVEKEFGSRPQEMRRVERGFTQHIKLESRFLEFLKQLLLLAEQRNIPFRSLYLLDPRVQRCVWEVKNNPMSHRFTEKELAGFAGVSVGQLNRLFQKHFGQTSGAWMDRSRLENAKHLLTTSQPVKEIAYNLGFSSPQHFASWFRKMIGQTPSGWRKGNRSAL